METRDTVVLLDKERFLQELEKQSDWIWTMKENHVLGLTKCEVETILENCIMDSSKVFS